MHSKENYAITVINKYAERGYRVKNFALYGDVAYCEGKNVIKTCPDSFVVCTDGKSRGVFKTLPEEYSGLWVVDHRGKIITPGLIDLHIHAPQYAFRGTEMDLELMDWLQAVTFPEEEKYADEQYAEKAYSIFAKQMKKSATTRACIFATKHTKATEILMGLMEETGLYTYVGKVNMDRGAPDELLDPAADRSAFETFGWINRCRGKFKRTKPILTPRFIPCCTEKLLEELREIQLAYGLPVQSHLSENRGEIEWVRENFAGIDFYGEGYDMYGLFGKTTDGGENVRTIMAHCVYSTAQEAELLRSHGVFVAHCPASNINLSSGIAPVRSYLDMGMRVGLGSDVAGGQTESVFRAMVDAVGASKLYWRLVDNKAKPLTFDEAFYMATKGGGEFFGNVGSFEDGYEFDAVVLDDSHLPYPGELSVRQRLERFAYLSGDVRGLKAKYVSGKKLFG